MSDPEITDAELERVLREAFTTESKKKVEDELIAIVLKIADAIENEGKAPWYHRRVWKRHRKEWPALWEGLDDLMRWYRGA